jgi:hypothetical protein
VVAQRGRIKARFQLQRCRRIRVTTRRPRPPSDRQQRDARLVEEDYPGRFCARPFLILGHSSATQRAIASSSRSRAWRSGRCRLQPSRPTSSRHTDARASRTPVTRWTTWATRSKVHRSVVNRLALAPCRSACSTWAAWASDSLGGHPAARRRRHAATRLGPAAPASVARSRARPHGLGHLGLGAALGQQFRCAQPAGLGRLWPLHRLHRARTMVTLGHAPCSQTGARSPTQLMKTSITMQPPIAGGQLTASCLTLAFLTDPPNEGRSTRGGWHNVTSVPIRSSSKISLTAGRGGVAGMPRQGAGASPTRQSYPLDRASRPLQPTLDDLDNRLGDRPAIRTKRNCALSVP